MVRSRSSYRASSRLCGPAKRGSDSLCSEIKAGSFEQEYQCQLLTDIVHCLSVFIARCFRIALFIITHVEYYFRMGFLHLFIVNKSGGLILHRSFGPKAPKIGTNDWLRIGSTFHSLYAIAAEASPVKLPGNKNSGELFKN